jgi:hypothetical protein
MVIEIFGFTIKPELSIGDIAAIGALIASPLIFYFGYSRTRKSEQIKIVRELIDRIEMKRKKLEDSAERLSHSDPGDETSDISVLATTVNSAFIDLLLEIDYFFHLLRTHEIEDENTLHYSLPRVASTMSFYDYPLDLLRRKKLLPPVATEAMKKAVGQQKDDMG